MRSGGTFVKRGADAYGSPPPRRRTRVRIRQQLHAAPRREVAPTARRTHSPCARPVIGAPRSAHVDDPSRNERMERRTLDPFEAAVDALRNDLTPRVEELASKSTDGALTPEEQQEYVEAVRLNDLLSLRKLQT